MTAFTILIVDDEILNRKLLETLLQPQGYRTVSVDGGENALASVAQQAPDLILLDVMMPGMNGYEVASILKADTATSNIPIIMVTALSDRRARLDGLEAGAEEFLNKPFDRDELWLRVRNLLRLKEMGSFLQNHALILEDQVKARTSQLQYSNEALEAFSYSVSHDLRAPLRTISGFTGLLSKEISSIRENERSQHFMDRINAGVMHMGDLIDALLSLAHVSRGDLHWEQVDMSAMAQSILNTYKESEPQRLVEINIQPGLTVQGDTPLLRQVLENLLGNAWKYSNRRPIAKIGFRRETDINGESVYAVQDNGAGFDMTYSDKLFVPFQRLHAASEFSGTGIGLSTVSRIITRHGGRVWSESAPDRGATFYFTLGKQQG